MSQILYNFLIVLVLVDKLSDKENPKILLARLGKRTEFAKRLILSCPAIIVPFSHKQQPRFLGQPSPQPKEKLLASTDNVS